MTGTVAGPVFQAVVGTLNGKYETQTARSLLGVGELGTLAADSTTSHAHVGTTLGGGLGDWRWYSNETYDRTRTTTLTDTGDAGHREAKRYRLIH